MSLQSSDSLWWFQHNDFVLIVLRKSEWLSLVLSVELRTKISEEEDKKEEEEVLTDIYKAWDNNKNNNQ